jgi:hypothetical protein
MTSGIVVAFEPSIGPAGAVATAVSVVGVDVSSDVGAEGVDEQPAASNSATIAAVMTSVRIVRICLATPL